MGLGADFTFKWEGTNVIERVKRAVERSEVAVAEVAVTEAKVVVHRITGTLSRSIHAAQPGTTDGASDEEAAFGGSDLTAAVVPVWEGDQALLEVGSWISYAINEEDLHPYLYPSIEKAAAEAPAIFEQAFAEEGLKV